MTDATGIDPGLKNLATMVLGSCVQPVWLVDLRRATVVWGNSAARAAWAVDDRDRRPLAEMGVDVPDALAAAFGTGDGPGDGLQAVRLLWPVRSGAERSLEPATAWRGEDDGRPVALVMLLAPPPPADDALLVHAARGAATRISVFTEDGRPLAGNPVASAGADADAPAPDLAQRFARPEDHDALMAALAADGRDSRTVRMRTGQAGTRWTLVDAHLSRVGGRTVISLLETDVDDLLQAGEAYRAEAEDAVATCRARTDFLSMITHEIRNHLNGVTGFAALLSQPPSGAERELTSNLIQSCHSLQRIADRMLDVARIEAGEMVVDKAAFKPFEILDTVRESYAFAAQRKGLSLTVKAGEGANIARLGDEFRITQIIENLVSNAIRFSDEGSVTVVISGPADAPLTIEVSDTGIGIPVDQRERIFQPYVQASGTTARRYGGSGLGLHIVQDLVRAMGGSLHLASEVGRGTAFTVSLPLPLAGPDGRVTGSLPPDLRVLAIASVHLDRTVLEMFLSAQEISPVWAASVEEARAALIEAPVDLILLDADAAGPHGLAQAHDMLRDAIDAGGDGPASIVLIACSRPDLRAGHAIFDGCLVKPLGIETLTACIGRCLSAADRRERRSGSRIIGGR